MGISFLFILSFFLDRDLTFSLCPPHPKTPTVSSQLPSKAGVRKGTAAVQVCMQTSEGMSTHRRSRRCSTNPPGGRRSGSGPGGSWGPPLPHTGLGHTLGKRQDLSAGSRPCLDRNTAELCCPLYQAPLCLCPHLQPEPSPQSCPCSPTPGAGLPDSPMLSVCPSPCPGPLTTAVAGAAGVLLKVGEESVAWAAGRGEALAQSLVTHWSRGPQGLSPGG